MHTQTHAHNQDGKPKKKIYGHTKLKEAGKHE